jgi:hypothetical protein
MNKMKCKMALKTQQKNKKTAQKIYIQQTIKLYKSKVYYLLSQHNNKKN